MQSGHPYGQDVPLPVGALDASDGLVLTHSCLQTHQTSEDWGPLDSLEKTTFVDEITTLTLKMDWGIT